MPDGMPPTPVVERFDGLDGLQFPSVCLTQHHAEVAVAKVPGICREVRGAP
jgi:hypothetical protein